MKYTRNSRQLILWPAAALLAASAINSMADDDSAGNQAKVASCVACHGADGVGKADQYPNLQGQKAAYTVKQLQDFKSGVRKNATMNTVARALSEADMKMLANFFTQVK